ncbi:hypothetical protein CDL60_08610 [Roseateles noduli]|nr:hypothetical protein CDL60_08610 [Roseateles noduli]
MRLESMRMLSHRSGHALRHFPQPSIMSMQPSNLPDTYATFAPEVQSLIRVLRSNGFTMGAGEGGHPVTSGERSMVRVLWRGHYVGRVDPTVGRGDRRGLLGYRFGAELGALTAPCPLPRIALTDLDPAQAASLGDQFAEQFAREHLIARASLSVWAEAEKSKGSWRWYLRIRDEETALHLMKVSAALLDAFEAGGPHAAAEELREDLMEIDAVFPEEADRKQLRDARVGQGKFRSDLLKAFGARCPVSGLGIEAALIASHIVAWRDDTTNFNERRDPDNGLLLAANIDALFDRHLLTFEADGAIRLSASLPTSELDRIGVMTGLSSHQLSKRAEYLARHRARFDDAERARGSA